MSVSTLSLLTFASCALLALAAVARAATPIRLQTDGVLPFTPEELEQTVAARLAMSAGDDATLVIVGPANEQGIRLHAGDKSALVAVGTRTGLAAARVVALAIAELTAGGETAAIPSPAAPAAPAVPTAPASMPTVVAPASAATGAPLAEPGQRPRVSLALEGSKGTDVAEPLTWGVAADVMWPRRSFDLAVALGLWDVPTRHAGRVDEASFVAGVARVGVGWHAGPVQLLAGPFLAAYRLEGGVDRTGVLTGGGVLFRVGRTLLPAAKLQVFGSLRVDAFANRVRVSLVGSDPTFASPRVAGAIGFGLGWDMGS